MLREALRDVHLDTPFLSSLLMVWDVVGVSQAGLEVTDDRAEKPRPEGPDEFSPRGGNCRRAALAAADKWTGCRRHFRVPPPAGPCPMYPRAGTEAMLPLPVLIARNQKPTLR